MPENFSDVTIKIQDYDKADENAKTQKMLP